MFIELVDSLRCLEPHEDTWLVAAVSRMDGRQIIEGTLGCPVCRRQYPVQGGVAWFSTTADKRLTRTVVTADPERVTRAAALLGLADSGGIVVLGGTWTDCADALSDVGAAQVVLLNAEPSTSSPQEVSALAVDDRLPFAMGALRAVALDREVATGLLLESSRDALRSRGRLVAPADMIAPDGVTVLARDAHDWVAEREVVASPPVTLRSVRR